MHFNSNAIDLLELFFILSDLELFFEIYYSSVEVKFYPFSDSYYPFKKIRHFISNQ